MEFVCKMIDRALNENFEDDSYDHSQAILEEKNGRLRHRSKRLVNKRERTFNLIELLPENSENHEWFESEKDLLTTIYNKLETTELDDHELTEAIVYACQAEL